MTTLTIIAISDFHSSAGLHAAGTTVATIETNLEPGELASLINTRHSITIESDADPDDHEPAVEPANVPNEPTNDPPADPPADPLTRSLADLIESKPAKLLADNDPSVTTVGELAAWIALGNRPSQISGIGPTTEAEILDVTGVTL